MVYALGPPLSIDHLKVRISDPAEQVTMKDIQLRLASFFDRLHLLLESSVNHIECHLLNPNHLPSIAVME